MKKQNLGKIITVGVLTGCLLAAGSVYADNTSKFDVPDVGIQVYQNGTPVPYSMYFRSGKLSVFPSNGAMAVNVTTNASRFVDHIYHDVTIYKNGVWQSSNRYEDWNRVELNTYLTVPAQSGDYIDVYVDHYTDHNGYLETIPNSKACYF